MRKLILIDRGNSSIHRFSRSLANRNYELISVRNIKDSISLLKNDSISLIIIDSSFFSRVSSNTKFKQLTIDIPKIVLIRQGDSINEILWSKDTGIYPLREPFSFKEFLYWTTRILQNKKLEIENRLLKKDIETRDKTLYFYSTITKAFTIPDTRKTLNSIMETAKTTTGAQTWSIILNDSLLFEKMCLRPSINVSKFITHKGYSITGHVMEEGIPLIVNDVPKDKRFNKKIDNFSGLKIKSLICAPLKINNKVIGISRLINKEGNRPFTDADMNILTNASNHIAIALDRAFLHYKIEEISITDDLTNLYNIRYLNQVIDIEIERARRYHSMFSLIFMDIDYFKKVNDRFGHLVGSRVLVELAQLLQKNLRKVDIITRYGGDEFVIVLPQTTREASFMVAERLRRLIEKNVFLKQEGHSIRLTASFGVASFPDNADNKEDLLRLADHAMYRGKFLTKNIVFEAK
jgi:diguanylate cyclase (GGDEF)-like protein